MPNVQLIDLVCVGVDPQTNNRAYVVKTEYNKLSVDQKRELTTNLKPV
jgi:hypothetical protein